MYTFPSADGELTPQKGELIGSPLSPQTPTSTDTLGMFEVVAYQFIDLLCLVR